jgi:hypothetical protein
VAAGRLAHEQILDVNAGATLPGRVVREEQREALDRVVERRHQQLEARLGAEAITQDVGLADLDARQRLALVDGELADQVDDDGAIVRPRRTDGELGDGDNTRSWG